MQQVLNIEKKENLTMRCQVCKYEFLESEVQESHDIPKYMFDDPKEADKHGRHWLCKECHEKYERKVLLMALMWIIKDNGKNDIKQTARSAAFFVKNIWFGGKK